MINVTKPYLPPKEEYLQYVDEIWNRCWLTNNGPIVNELELRLKDYLGLEHLLFLGNGTIAIQIAIKTLELEGEIITTPFSYVATTSSIVWENCKPVFVDIDERSLNIKPELIEAAITDKTSAILATHVFGIPCEVEKIEAIAKKHQLKVIYDAAHCFGTKYKGKSILGWGDISTCSFHATKLFHTIEGGAVCSNSPDLIFKMAKMRNFGHDGPFKFLGVGVNGKNSEFHAAMGVVNLKHIADILEARKRQHFQYQKWLKNLKVRMPKPTMEQVEWNYAYFPVIFETEEALLKAEKALQDHYIYPRRYFYPSLNKLEYVEGKPCPVSESVSSRVLCLPVFHDMTESTVDLISRVLLRAQNYG
ncbi:MAG: DegT/DnrJ/EryC1/StrS family aminotransferase [Lewinellaceae bacterium]|nr:DegT/DnrJ/EryC1/StrS family aminotransferase [Saprospiraceae bacterium]MCB9338334.1 DegT/DnrJ/EryC1/StrS family aminotransferase [Lewinellaceae bacterium]